MIKNNKYSKDTIIVSGMPRTATTIVGRLISYKMPYSTIYEPFNISQGLKSVDINYLIPNSNISEYNFDKIFNGLLNLDGQFRLGVKLNDSSLKKIIKYIIGNESSISFKKAKYVSRKRGLILKDPFLLFASKYIAKNHKVIMCERPLLPLAGSFKRMSWSFDEYSRLLKDFNIIDIDIQKPNQFNNGNISPFVIGAIQFFYLYSVFKRNLLNDDNIYMFDQNELSVNPNQSIMSLFDWLNIDYSKNDIDKIVINISGSSKKNKSPKEGVQHDHLYDKQHANDYFNSILTNNEIEYVKECERVICSGGEI
ncbi:MAG: hypothetical protein HOL62_00290 [Candidatus Marinimicrobia bacterium]|nr:hypothetical protein [Candidatus Neomarinimicrobiota bacterium]MBT4925814.1 hypothetical protein [Candidatus Neomarinimicrobiota bacterium]MBT5251132.1 hypothetical protein [Candidatus Neomarinimicrobiota bacterium]MBT6868060.1 hypothetical protein [Candidatus Neomarinimicrobiota bacterium]MBT7172164.1 hypothetical protein [Candidatus Neomarinimicrobiota bacterium]